MAEWSIASDLKSEGLKRFREFESHSLLTYTFRYLLIKRKKEAKFAPPFYESSAKSTSMTFPETEFVPELLLNSFFKNSIIKIFVTYFKYFIIFVVIS